MYDLDIGRTATVGESQAVNNSTVRHRNPRVVDESGDLVAVRSWLASRLGSILIDCTTGLQRGRSAVCSRLDEEYPKWLEKYVDVVDETTTDEDDTVGEAFRQAGRHQSTFRSRVTEFRETYRSYQEARSAGNTSRARQLARRLTRLSRAINDSGGALTDDYRVISRRSDTNLSTGIRTIRMIVRNTSARATRVERSLFVDTRLSVTAPSKRVSFLNPLRVSGRLATQNGSAIANRRIRFRVANQRIQTTTDGNGNFEFAYRPTRLRLAMDRVRIRYMPRNTSVYATATATLPVRVEQVTPSIRVARSPTRAGFNDVVRVSGRVSARGIAVSRVPVVIAIDGQRVARVTTNSNGSFATGVQIPAWVQTGSQRVRVRLPFNDRALAGTETTTRLTIAPTATSLSLSGSNIDVREVRVSGRLRTLAGTPVVNQRVSLWMAGDRLTTVRTTSGGEFRSTIEVPRAVAARNESVTVVARFTGAGTNLNASEARTTIRLQMGSAAGFDARAGGTAPSPLTTLFRLPGWQMIAIAVLTGLVVIGVAFVVGRRFVGRGAEAAVLNAFEPTALPSSESDAAVDDAGDEPVEREAVSESVTRLDRVEEVYGMASDEAVLAAYWIVRDQLEIDTGVDGAQTHWEFYRACDERGFEKEPTAALERLTVAYERAAFAPTALSPEQIADALSDARTILGASNSDD